MRAYQFFGFCTLFIAAPVWATSIFYVSPERMMKEADVVILAEVQDSRVEFDKEINGPKTYSELKVVEGIKGSRPGDVLWMSQHGDESFGGLEVLSGLIHLKRGETVLLFAKWHPLHRGQLLVAFGGGQGKYEVYRNDQSLMVRPNYGSLNFREREHVGQKPVKPMTEAQPLNAFVRKLRQSYFKDKAPIPFEDLRLKGRQQ